MPKYILIDHTADIGIDVFGESLQELFSNAAFAMFDIIADLSNVKNKDEYRISVSGVDREQLMVNWLSELLYLHDVRSLLFKDFTIINITDTQLDAIVRGERYKDGIHVIKTEMKAVTYHNLSIVRKDSQWQGRIIFDL
ncbi:MAG TPA: archease [Candidatus Brocadiaceae bacterium]